MSTRNRLLYEINDVKELKSNGIDAFPKDDNLYNWTAIIQGNKNTPYENGTFILNIEFPKDYPFNPPIIFFQTKIYHCNINSSGGICLDILKDQWSPALTLNKILLSIISLMNDPNPDDPLVPEIAELYKNNRVQFNTNAKQHTLKYAKSTIQKNSSNNSVNSISSVNSANSNEESYEENNDNHNNDYDNYTNNYNNIDSDES